MTTTARVYLCTVVVQLSCTYPGFARFLSSICFFSSRRNVKVFPLFYLFICFRCFRFCFFNFLVHIHYKFVVAVVPTRDYFTKRAKSFLTTDIKLAKCFCPFALPDSRCHFASLSSRCPSAGNGTGNCVVIKVQTPFAWYVLSGTYVADQWVSGFRSTLKIVV